MSMDNLGESPPEAKRASNAGNIDHKNGEARTQTRKSKGFRDKATRTVGGLALLGSAWGMMDLARNTQIGSTDTSNSHPTASADIRGNGDKFIKENGITIIDEREDPDEIKWPKSFNEIFPNIRNEEEKKALRVGISAYQKIHEENGIGTFDAHPTMGKLLLSEVKDENGNDTHFELLLRKYAVENKVNPALIKSVLFIESKGDKDAVNEVTEATGIGQFMEVTAKDPRFGLIDKNGVDYRKDPARNLEAACKYLGILSKTFGGNMGFAIWAYHAGEGNVSNGLKAYYSSTNPPIYDLDIILEKVANKEINIFTFMNSQAAKDFIKRENLGNFTEDYAIKAAAAAEYFEENPVAISGLKKSP